MIGILLPVLQGAGSVALAFVAFALAFTWPALLAPLVRLRTEAARLAGFAGLGLVLVLAASLIYATPGVLLRDPVGLLLAFPVAALWLIGAAGLLVRGVVLGGAARGISIAFAVVAGCGALAGIVSAVLVQHGVPDTVTPTGAFLLAVGALAAVVFWARAEEPDPRPAIG
ncbi:MULTISPECIES: hypothetical protein [Leifsonia]|uniref:Uncharacterized protein n=1 Tax=Leifsonia soli TaxID=582665 RepID=A0A852T1M9_9MICO|nr:MULTISPECIES: hypothetical protein [Leifsonia]NYD75349.1 hypothetical protein [Leifsonia soli]SEB14320.1 hypothetical protein SAMN04515680_3682 [Leifsonia sp. 21MFCrub1.1]